MMGRVGGGYLVYPRRQGTTTSNKITNRQARFRMLPDRIAGTLFTFRYNNKQSGYWLEDGVEEVVVDVHVC